MNVLKKAGIFFIACLLSFAVFHDASLHAQDMVAKGLDSIETIYNIKYRIPEGFSNPNIIQQWKPDISTAGSVIYSVFVSKDKQCKVLYPVILPVIHDTCSCYSHRDIISRDFFSIYKTEDLDLDHYLRILPQKDALKRFNADSVFLYSVPTAIYKSGEEYAHCTKMILTKQGRPKLELVFYFTEKAKRKEEKYIKKINRKIWYNDNPDWIWNQDRCEEWIIKYFYEISDFITPQSFDDN